MPRKPPRDDLFVKPKIEIAGITIEWDVRKGTCTFEQLPVAMMWVDTTLAGLMSGVQAMVGTERFALALQAEGRKSVESDWEVISRFSKFEDGFKAIADIAAVAGWGEWRLLSVNRRKKECRFRIKDSWEGRYQKALGVCWGSGMLAGKLAGYASRLFSTNCWAEQTSFIAQGEPVDEFVVRASERTIEKEIEDLLVTDEATKADMAIALNNLQTEIGERRRAEEEMVKERNLSRVMFDSLPGVFYLFDREGRFLRWNKAFETVTGYSSAEISRLHPVDLFRGPDRELIADRIRLSLKTGMADAEAEIVSQDGRATPYYFTGRRIEIDGRTCIIGMGVDISERIRAERALRESEEKHRFLTENMADIIWTIGLDMKTTYVSPSIEKVLGFTPEERVRQKLEEVITPGSYQRVMARFQDELAREGEPGADPDRDVTLETEYYRRDGSTVWMENRVQALRDQTGAMVGMYGVSRDITQRKRAEEDLARTLGLFEAIFQHHPNPLVLVRRDDGLVRMVNRAFEREWGFRQDEVTGWSARTFYADPASRDEMLARLAREGTLRDFESLGRRADGTTAPVLLSVEPVDIAGEAHLIVAFQDVTRRKVEEEEKDRLERQLRQAQKLEAIGRLAGGMAHDFNNLLAVIMGYSQLVLRRVRHDAPFRQELEAIDQASGRAASLIRQLLAFSRRQILQPEVLDLNRLVSDTEQMLRRLIGEDIDLITFLEPDLGRVQADRGQIEQLIVNLAVNARDAIDGIGKVTIETADVYLDEAYCREHTDASPGRHAMLALSDTGQGMDEDTKSRIFDPFFTTKDPDKGTGLGLATVYGIVKQSGGAIYVYSEPGQGTTFKIYLPVVEDEETAPPPEPEEESFPRGTETVLVVEDEDGVRKFILDVLRYAGYTVLEARHGVEALEVCQGSREPIHLVITDVVMPRMSGRELGKSLAETCPDTRVLFMSGYTDNAVVHHGMLDQGINFIAKPFTPAALAQKIRKILDDQA